MVLAVLLFVVFFSYERRYHQLEHKNLEKNFIAREKEWLKISVNEQIAHLIARKKLVEQELRETLKKKVGNASRIADYLYETGISQGLEQEVIATRIREAIRPLYLNQGEGQYFISSLAGISLLCQSDPSREGQGITAKSPENRIQVFQQAIDIATTTGQGFMEYQWPKPGPHMETLYKRISFVSYFEPLDWYIGCGEYVVDFEEHIKERVIAVMNTPGWSGDSNNYLYILDLHDINGGEQFATMLVNPNDPDFIDTVISDSYRDADGKEFVKEYMQGIRKNGEAFVTYRFKKPGSGTPETKMSYVKLLPEWNWLIFKGMYLDDIERLILTEKIAENRLAKKELSFFLLLFVIALCCSLILSFFFSRKLQIIFKEYRMNKEKLQQELQEQRDSLEDQVEQRTLELKETSHQLIHSEKLSAIGRLSASIAHEFNNPLNGIQSVLEGVQGSSCLEQEDVNMVGLALSECERVRKLIRNLLDFNAPSHGKRKVFNLQEALDLILSMSAKELKNCSIRVHKEYVDDLPLIMAVPDQIKQVLLNLINNARDVMQESGGLLTLQTEQKDQQVVVHISDTGPGIDQENLGQIFEPFFTTKSVVKGTGLGLSISYGIIKNHGGRIDVQSVPGKGTTFSLTLPIEE